MLYFAWLIWYGGHSAGSAEEAWSMSRRGQPRPRTKRNPRGQL